MSLVLSKDFITKKSDITFWSMNESSNVSKYVERNKAKTIFRFHFPSYLLSHCPLFPPNELIWLNTSIKQPSLYNSVFVLGSVQKQIGLWCSLSTASCPIRHLIWHHFLMMIIIVIILTTSLKQNCSKGKTFSSLKHPLDTSFPVFSHPGGQCPKPLTPVHTEV